MDKALLPKLLIGEPVEFTKNVFIHVPTIRQVIDEETPFESYVTPLTVMTRQIFVTAREVDKIELEYPTVWELMCHPELNLSLGGLTGQEGKLLSDLIIDSISYWTKLPNPPRDVVDNYTDEEKKENPLGFKFLENGSKIINFDTEWIIDKEEFERFVGLIKAITNYQKPEDLAPKIKSDNAHEKWLDMYKNKQKLAKRQEVAWADKIIMMQVMSPSFIPIDEIMKMSLFNFNEIFKALNQKEAYDISMGIALSAKFMSEDGKVKFPKNWKEEYKVISNKNI